MSKKPDTERDEAIATLRELLKPGDKVTTTVLNVSRSGMSRSIMCQIVAPDYNGKPAIRDVSWLVSRAIREPLANDGGVKVGGCGMNMCFHTVYSLGRALFPDGFGIEGERRPPMSPKRARPNSRRHAAQLIRAGYVFRGRNGDASGWDDDGGYALEYR